MRQKHYWEIRIRELGGGDYNQLRRQFVDIGNYFVTTILRYHHTIDGKELPGAPNYKYYGAAKELPGVRELFAELEEAAEKKRLHRFKSHLALLFSSPIYRSLLCCLSPAL